MSSPVVAILDDIQRTLALGVFSRCTRRSHFKVGNKPGCREHPTGRRGSTKKQSTCVSGVSRMREGSMRALCIVPAVIGLAILIFLGCAGSVARWCSEPGQDPCPLQLAGDLNQPHLRPEGSDHLNADRQTLLVEAGRGGQGWEARQVAEHHEATAVPIAHRLS